MAERPASQFTALDTLIARATATRRATRSSPKPRPSLPSPRPLAALERDSSIARAPSRPESTPTALALWITVARCACGSVTRCPPAYALVKYAENEHTIHYVRTDMQLATLPRDLPRELREKEINIPFCEECFR